MGSRSILIIAPYLPLPATFGGALRILNLIRHLASDHDVTLLAPATQAEYPHIRELGEICNVTAVPAATTARQPASRSKRVAQIRSMTGGRSFLETAGYYPQMQPVIDRIFMTRRVDLVQFEFPESALYTLSRPVPTVFDAHNVEHDLLGRVARTAPSTSRQIFNMLEARKLKRLEVAAWTAASVCVATSDRDAELIRSLTSTPVEVVPNGVDLDTFSVRDPGETLPGMVVFTGAMRHQPNADGATWYATRVHPLVQRTLPDATFAIVGADPPEPVRALASSSIEVTGEVDDIRPWLGRAQVVAVPLWSGGGTRLKVLEAFAAGRPVVSTSIGAEGIDARHGEHLLIADTPEAFAAAVVQLTTDSDLAGRITSAARLLVEERYGWASVSRRLVDAHRQAISRFEASTDR